MIKNITTFVLLLTSTIIFGQQQDCKIAADSVLAKKNRGEIAYYYPTKFNANQFFFIVFKDNKYSKKQIPLNSISNEFMKCFNEASQPLLDNSFKTDFFRKADSILSIYDKAGLGYRNTDFPGGAFGLQKFLKKNIVLPEDAKPNNTDNLIRVHYSFLIDEEGKISDIKLIKSNCQPCEEVILNVIQFMPNFIPATEAGRTKSVRYILPFSKKL